MKKTGSLLLKLILLTSLSLLSAENFRIMEMHQVALSPDGSKTTLNAGINDGICITLPEDRRFIQGIQIDLRIPKIIASYRDSVTTSFWTDCENGASEIDFRGNKIFLDTVPPKLSQTLQLELDGRSIKKDPYAAIIPYAITETDSSVVLRFQLAMKGVPADFFDAQFEIDVKALLSNEGVFTLDFEYPDREQQTETELQEDASPVLVYIDELPCDSWSEVILPSGIHHLSVISENYRNEVRTFTIEQAKETQITVDLKAVTPELFLVAPENVLIYVDDIPVENRDEKQLISPGGHIVRFVLADYELSKYFEAVSGRTYTISMNVSLEMLEE